MDKSLRILVVDDFPTMRRIVRNLLKELGFENVEEAEDGAMAMDMLKKGNFRFVISDWNMPNMDGLTLLKTIRADEAMKSLPVLMVTAEAKKENIIAAAQAGASGYVVKPFTAATLEEKLNKIFEKWRSERHGAYLMDARDSQDQPAATGKEDLFIRVARLTRLLQNSMRELGLDQKVRDAAEVIPDARDRLRYVANLTEQAATRVLGAIEQAQPLQGEIDQGAQALLARWQAGSRAGGVADADLPADTCAYLQTAARNAEATHGHLLDIMMAQDFQDLTGQVIMKLTDLIGTLEKELLQVLLDHVPQEKRDEAEGLLNGPQVRVEGRTDIVSSQDQVDDLLSELGL